MQAKELLREGDLAGALEQAKADVRQAPSEAKHRVLLFQLLCLAGDWDRAMNQLNVAADLDASCSLMAQVCRQTINCEVLRREIFAGRRTPLVLGEPGEWIGLMIQANRMLAEGRPDEFERLRERAFESAPAFAGTIDGEAFEWIADADVRFGPVVEAIIDGRYYWVPFEHIHRMEVDAPADLRDVVWAPARFQWVNGGDAVALLPARYPGTEASSDDMLRMARRTEFVESGGVPLGVGQRMWATDTGEYPMLATRRIVLDNAAFEPAPEGGEAEQGGGEGDG